MVRSCWCCFAKYVLYRALSELRISVVLTLLTGMGILHIIQTSSCHSSIIFTFEYLLLWVPCDRDTVVLIVSCWCTYWNHVLKPILGKRTRHYSRFCAVAFCYVQNVNCHTSQCPWHDIKLHPHQVKLCQIGCIWSGFVLVKVVT